ncbi:glycosyltransferase family 2 protein [Litorisediminicola beolgyonensis]|uniref:Glycosyltransferase family 2 protein n=1 Tax=Litorisediminicola beolgyonensis TaxID=1173614 RepID=A0ABW3ZGP8_9RHOB
MARLLTVLLNWRTPEMTCRAIDAAAAALSGLDAELVVVDNDSGDGSEEALRAHIEGTDLPIPARVVQSGRNGGFGAGNNVGIRAGRADGVRPDYVQILNSDAFPAPDALRRLHDHLEAHPEVGFAGSFIHGEDGTPHETAFRFPSILSEIEGAARTGPVTRLLARHRVPLGLPDATRRVDWLAGASMMMRMDVLEQIGLFDEGFFLYFEETDLCLRAARAGYTVDYIRDSHVAHIGSVSTGMKGWSDVPTYWFDSRWRYFAKAHGRGYAVAATLGHVLGGAIWRLRVLLTGKPRVDPPGFLRRLLSHDLAAARAARPRDQTIDLVPVREVQT